MTIATIFIVLILLILAYAAWRFLPDPIGWIAAAIIGVLALWILVSNLAESGELETSFLATPPLLAACRRWRLRGLYFKSA